jgi:ribosomal protein L37E
MPSDSVSSILLNENPSLIKKCKNGDLNMTTTNQDSIGNEVGRRLVKTAIAVVGLLAIRVAFDFILRSSTGEREREMMEAWSRAVSPVIGTPPQPVTWDSFPKIFIAHATIDTLIYAVLIWSAAGFNGLIRSRSKRLPEGGLMILLFVLTLVVALAYRSYSYVIPPLLGNQAGMYGWFFLVLGLLPLIGLMIVAFRNLDAITEVIFSAARQTGGGASQRVVTPSSGGTQIGTIPSPAASLGIICSKCGSAVAAGAKFCSVCGSTVAVPEDTDPICPSCGTKQERGAKFCEHCGKPLQPQGASL